MGETNPGDSSFVENQKNDSNYMSGFPANSWDDSAILSESFLKGLGDDHDDNKAVSNVGAFLKPSIFLGFDPICC